MIAGMLRNEKERVAEHIWRNQFLRSTSATDTRCLASAASRMGWAQWRLSYMRVVRVTLRRTASSRFIDRTSLGCV